MYLNGDNSGRGGKHFGNHIARHTVCIGTRVPQTNHPFHFATHANDASLHFFLLTKLSCRGEIGIWIIKKYTTYDYADITILPLCFDTYGLRCFIYFDLFFPASVLLLLFAVFINTKTKPHICFWRRKLNEFWRLENVSAYVCGASVNSYLSQKWREISRFFESIHEVWSIYANLCASHFCFDNQE